MKTLQKLTPFVSIALFGAVPLILPAPAFGQAPSREKAQLILDEVKQRKLESQIKAKQTELQRLEEDHSKRQEEAENLQRSIETIASAIGESSGSLDRLTAERKRLTDQLTLTNQRIEAERLKLDGLKALSDAQTKAQELALSQSEEASLRNAIGKAELKLLTRQSPPPGGEAPKEDAGKLDTEIGELKKKLTKSERTTLNAGRLARETMAIANDKLVQADKADLKAKKTAAGIGQDEVPGTEKANLDPVAAPPNEAKKP